MRLFAVTVAFMFLGISSAHSQQADPKDVSSTDSITGALYDVISGPAGSPRDWNRFRSLFVPEARLISIGRDSTGAIIHRAWSTEQYIEVTRSYFDQNSFFEIEIARKEDRYGNMAHIFSTYESYRNADDDEPFSRGINSIQLLYQNDRWWIVTIFWQPEWPTLPLPPAYLPNNTQDN